MSPTPEAPRRPPFDPLTIFLHWTTVLLVLAQFATALAKNAIDPEQIPILLMVHRSTGTALWCIVVFRLVWRFTGMKLPPFPDNFTKVHSFGVHVSEYGLYGLLLLQPVTGMAMSLARGRPFPLFGAAEVPALMERNKPLAHLLESVHSYGGWALAGVIGLHATAALFHHYILKDEILASMAPVMRRKPKVA